MPPLRLADALGRVQVLRAAETLPLVPDDVHVIISAYGSFAAALADLCRMSFPQEVTHPGFNTARPEPT